MVANSGSKAGSNQVILNQKQRDKTGQGPDSGFYGNPLARTTKGLMFLLL